MEKFSLIFIGFIFGGSYSTIAQIFRMVLAIFVAYMAKNCPIFGTKMKIFLWLLALMLLIITYFAELINALSFIGVL
jgi:hypothetical protein